MGPVAPTTELVFAILVGLGPIRHQVIGKVAFPIGRTDVFNGVLQQRQHSTSPEDAADVLHAVGRIVSWWVTRAAKLQIQLMAAGPRFFSGRSCQYASYPGIAIVSPITSSRRNPAE